MINILCTMIYIQNNGLNKGGFCMEIFMELEGLTLLDVLLLRDALNEQLEFGKTVFTAEEIERMHKLIAKLSGLEKKALEDWQ
jgi:hypothetical protein